MFNSGCLERHYQYRINLDGQCDFTYQAKGDSADIYDPLGSYPEAPFYRLKTWTETDTAGKLTYVLEAQTRYDSANLPATLGLREVAWTKVLLQHPVALHRSPYYFFNLNGFKMTFAGRQQTELEGDRWKYIPPECRVLEDSEDSTLSDAERRMLEEKYAAGLLLWNVERYKTRFREIMKQTLAQRPVASVPQAWVDSALTELDSLVESHFQQTQAAAIGGDLDKISLEWWPVLEPGANRILAQNLNMMGDSSLIAEALRVSELLEMRHQVGEDLLDESFEIRVDLPGRITQSNSTTMDAGVLVWKYLGQDFQEGDVVLEASSLYLFPSRIVTALALAAIGVLLLRFRRARRRAEFGPGLPPPPPRGK